jgi:hypothetical protein
MLLCVHVCDVKYIYNLVVFKHLKVARRDFSNHVFPEPFSDTSRHANTAAHHVASFPKHRRINWMRNLKAEDIE